MKKTDHYFTSRNLTELSVVVLGYQKINKTTEVSDMLLSRINTDAIRVKLLCSGFHTERQYLIAPNRLLQRVLRDVNTTFPVFTDSME